MAQLSNHNDRSTLTCLEAAPRLCSPIAAVIQSRDGAVPEFSVVLGTDSAPVFKGNSGVDIASRRRFGGKNIAAAIDNLVTYETAMPKQDGEIAVPMFVGVTSDAVVSMESGGIKKTSDQKLAKESAVYVSGECNARCAQSDSKNFKANELAYITTDTKGRFIACSETRAKENAANRQAPEIVGILGTVVEPGNANRPTVRVFIDNSFNTLIYNRYRGKN